MADELPTSTQELAVEPPPVADISASSEPAVIASAPESHDMPPPAPKRKGRPPGAKDTIKRVRKPPVQIRVEPINVEPVERVSTPRPKAEPKTESKQLVEIEEDPPTPRTLLREASRHYVSLRSLVHDKKKSEIVNMYTQKLTPWPV